MTALAQWQNHHPRHHELMIKSCNCGQFNTCLSLTGEPLSLNGVRRITGLLRGPRIADPRQLPVSIVAVEPTTDLRQQDFHFQPDLTVRSCSAHASTASIHLETFLRCRQDLIALSCLSDCASRLLLVASIPQSWTSPQNAPGARTAQPRTSAISHWRH